MFLESILFFKNWKFQKKTFLPYFGDSIAGKLSRMPQLQARGSILATYSRVEGPVARSTQRFLRLISRLTREWNFLSRKTLRKFFKAFVMKCFGGWFWRLSGDLPQPRKTRVLHNKGRFKKKFQLSLELFVTVHCLFYLKLPKHTMLPTSNSIVTSFQLKIFK